MSLRSVREIKGEPVHNNEGEKEKKLLNRFGGATRCKVVVILKGYKLGTSELLIVWKSDCLNRRYETLLA
jgi:hypothetical protein